MSTEASTIQNNPTEVIEVKGNKLIETVKELIAKGNINRVVIYWSNGDKLLDVPYTAGLTVGALMTFFMPILTLLTPMALLLGRFRIEVSKKEDEASEEVEAEPEESNS